MPGHISEAPVLQISRFYTGLYTFRNPLIVPVKLMGRRLIELYDAIQSGQNMELTNTLTLKRRPGYTSYNTQPISGIPQCFYSFKPSSFPGQLYPIVDTTTNVLYTQPGTAAPVSLITKTSTDQTNYCGIGPYLYMGNPKFQQKWDGPLGPQGVTNWGISISSLSNAIGPNGAGNGADVAAPGSASVWANPGRITANDGSFATTTLTPTGGGPASQGPNACSTTVSGGWANSGNIKVNDGNYATYVILPLSNSGDIQARNFGFAVPLSATITGITVKVTTKRVAGTAGITDNDVTLLKAGSPTGSNLASGSWGGPVPLTTTYAGGLWGTTWNPSDINSATFGVQVSATNNGLSNVTAGIDFISITVGYTTAGTTATVSDYLQGTQFGFSIPATNSVTGIQVDVKGLQTQTPTTGLGAQILKAGSLTGSVKTGQLPASNGFITFGGPGDLWGATWTPNDINQTTFGVALQALNPTAGAVSYSADYVRITIYGVGGPTVTLVAGTLTAQTGFQYQFCYGNSNSGHVSSPTPPSAVITPIAQGVQVTLVASSDPQVNQIRVFRTTDGGGQPFFELPSSPYPNTNANIVDNAPDNTLQIANICPLPHFNDPPPAGLVDPVWFSGRLWGHIGNLLYFSSGPDITMGNGPEAWFPVYVFALPTTIVRKFPLPNGMLVVTVDDIYVVRGIDTLSFTVNEFMRDIGMRNWNAGDSDGSNVYFYTTDRQMLLLNANGLQSISGAISDVIANVDPSVAYVSTFRYTARNTMLFLGDGTTNIYPYNLSQQAWCPVQAPTSGAQALGSIETQPGIYNFLVGKTATGLTIGQRSITTFTDEGTPYACNVIFGPIPFADSLTLAQLRDIVVSTAVGQSAVGVSVLANDISGQFQPLQITSSEPPELSATPSQSFTSNRYSWMSATIPEFVNFIELQLTWPTASTADELYLWAIGGSQTTGGSTLAAPGQLPEIQGR